MHKIISKTFFSENVVQLEIEAPRIATARKAGHFVMIRADKNGERIPLTISSANIKTGTITLVIQTVGVTSTKLAELNIGDEIHDLVGPLGKATEIPSNKTILAAGGGVGVAPLLPIIETLAKNQNKVVVVIGARNKDLIILEEQVKKYAHQLIIMTDDGSYGQKGLITEGMEQAIKDYSFDEAIVIGPAIMMKFASETTKKHKIPTTASLNTIMVDGTGMCGACRVTIDGKTKFVCVDGPEFDAHKVDFDEMLLRLGGFKNLEQEALNNYAHKQND